MKNNKNVLAQHGNFWSYLIKVINKKCDQSIVIASHYESIER